MKFIPFKIYFLWILILYLPFSPHSSFLDMSIITKQKTNSAYQTSPIPLIATKRCPSATKPNHDRLAFIEGLSVNQLSALGSYLKAKYLIRIISKEIQTFRQYSASSVGFHLDLLHQRRKFFHWTKRRQLQLYLFSLEKRILIGQCASRNVPPFWECFQNQRLHYSLQLLNFLIKKRASSRNQNSYVSFL